MTNQAYPSLNGIAPSWADISTTFSVTGGSLIEMADIAALKWSRKLEPGIQYGTGGRPMKRTAGQLSVEASATLYRSGLRTLIKGLQAVAPTRGSQVIIGQIAFDILVQHTPYGETEIYVHKLKGCRYLGDSDDMKEGQEPDKIELTLNPMEIVQIINGQEIVLL